MVSQWCCRPVFAKAFGPSLPAGSPVSQLARPHTNVVRLFGLHHLLGLEERPRSRTAIEERRCPTRVTPNPSFERTATGEALGPRASQCHHPSRGPSASPAPAAQLKR